MTTKEVCKLLNKRPETISRYVKQGMPHALKDNGKPWKEYEYDKQEVVAWYQDRFPERKIRSI